MKKLFLSLIFLLLASGQVFAWGIMMAGGSTPVSGGSCSAGDAWTSEDANKNIGNSTNIYMSIAFTPTQSKTIKKITIKLKRAGTVTANKQLIVEIRSSTGGEPVDSGVYIDASAIDFVDIATDDYYDYDVYFTGAAVTADGDYRLVLYNETSGTPGLDATNFIRIRHLSTGTHKICQDDDDSAWHNTLTDSSATIYMSWFYGTCTP